MKRVEGNYIGSADVDEIAPETRTVLLDAFGKCYGFD